MYVYKMCVHIYVYMYVYQKILAQQSISDYLIFDFHEEHNAL